ncbi:MAG TPA: Xaa-Pro peptidase family protein [Euzebya sp.]|nr:Xaa-Pro peptidase family protein [Euzebya sp.]
MTQPTPLQRAAQAMTRRGVAALLIGPGADLTTLTSYRAHLSERLTLLVARAGGPHTLIVPALERPVAEAGSHGVDIHSYDEGQDPLDLVAAALEATPSEAVIGVGDQLWATFLLGVQQIRPQARWQPASIVTREVRMAKDTAGLEGLRRAGRAIDAVHRRMAEFLVAGRTEAEAGTAIASAMHEEGHDHAAFVIVGSGPNGASPHHETSDRVMRSGDAVVVDIGGPVAGWFSDCTRNYVLGQAPEGYRAAFDVLQAAQRAAVAQVRPGVTAASVDAAARQVISDAGFGPAFIHRTGHGIGLEVHEEPWITAGNQLLLAEGMTFSVEPGIYLDGRFGMRIEDIVAVTSDGVERLNTTDIALVHLPS